MRFIKLVRFIKKYRQLGIASFNITTNSTEIVVYVIDKEKGVHDQIRFTYS